MWYHSDVVLTQ